MLIKEHYTLMEYITGFAPLWIPLIFCIVLGSIWIYAENNNYKYPILKLVTTGISMIWCIIFGLTVLMFVF